MRLLILSFENQKITVHLIRKTLKSTNNNHHKKLRLKKLFNRALVEIEYRLGSVSVSGYPWLIFVDTIDSCNLHCPLCPTGTKMKGREKGSMSKEVFDRVLSELGEYAQIMCLYNWGEPLLHREIFNFIKCTERFGIKCQFSSNLNIFNEKMAEEMIQSGLKELTISMDGMTAETYLKYRVGGDFEMLKKNVKLLEKTKQRLGSMLPKTILQFIVFKFNEHEVPKVKKMADELQVDAIDIIAGTIGGKHHTPYTGHSETRKLTEKWLTQKKGYKGAWNYFRKDDFLSPKRCWFLWKSVVINPDGGVAPCCNVYRKAHEFGNIMEEPFADIWNNTKYHSARSKFSMFTAQSTNQTACSSCRYFRPPSFRIPLKR